LKRRPSRIESVSDFHAATSSFEAWMTRRMRVVPPDLARKHEKMSRGPFPFLRGTAYRFFQQWPLQCPELVDTPTVLAVGDLHLENFGAWRDQEGRLVWGVNDFDEATPLPFTFDLVRLATSLILYAEAESLGLSIRSACDALIEGYRESLEQRGRPVVLDDHHGSLRALAESARRSPIEFWGKMEALPEYDGRVPRAALALLRDSLPDRSLALRLKTRTAGLGSLGHPRVVALTEWRGGRLAREAKRLMPSSAFWAAGTAPDPIAVGTILARAVRSPDPAMRVDGHWLVRRLKPENVKIELGDSLREQVEQRLLYAMGWETANIHLGTPKARKVVPSSLVSLPPSWLSDAAERMAASVHADFAVWRSR
jgi:hypothetical protein